MNAAPVEPVPPPPPVSPPVDSPSSSPARRVPAAAMLLLILVGVLVGWRWYADPTGPRPTEMQPGAVHRIDLNRAGRSELMQIPGVGPNLAERILSHRDQRGRFTRVDDLEGIHGIGDATLSRLRPWLMVTEPGEELSVEPDRLSRRPTNSDSRRTPSLAGRPININIATLDELNALPNIGPVLAQRIVDERTRKEFTSLEDLRRVRGIGPKRLEALRDRIRFEE